MRNLGRRVGYRLGYGLGLSSRRASGLSAELLAKFLFLWTGKYDGDDLLSDLSTDVITVTDKDWITKVIPETSAATFAVPENATYIAADGTDNFWFSALDALLEKTFTNLIESTSLRTFVKYTDFEPYEVSAIGILKEGETLTDADKIELNTYFKLWVQYWSDIMAETGYMKDNRVLTESAPLPTGITANSSEVTIAFSNIYTSLLGYTFLNTEFTFDYTDGVVAVNTMDVSDRAISIQPDTELSQGETITVHYVHDAGTVPDGMPAIEDFTFNYIIP